MTRDEYIQTLRAFFKEHQSQTTQAMTALNHLTKNLIAWTHCHHCGRSNQRMDCSTTEDLQELQNACLEENWKCFFCNGTLTVYAGYDNGIRCELPSRQTVIDELITAVLLGEEVPLEQRACYRATIAEETQP